MVRNYIRKTTRGLSYPKERLLEAVEDVKCGKLNAYKASQLYGIPKNTIVHHVKGRRGVKSKTCGRPLALPYEEELKLVKGIQYMEKYGFGLSRKEIIEMVGDYVKANKIVTPFKNEVPSEDWFLNFMQRHKLSIKKPQSVEYARKKCCDPFVIYEYFALLKKTILELKLEDKPNQIWNVDETSFCTDPSKTKVVGKKGFPSTRTTSSTGKENITVLMGGSAGGKKVPPLIVFKGKNIWDSWTASQGTGFPGTTYASSSNGWMETEIFENYFERSFLKTVGTERPVLLIYDGHSTHVGLQLTLMAIRQNITILKLPPHSSHLLQPFDLAVFKSLKTKWDSALVKWQRQHIGSKLPKREFSKMIGQLWLDMDPDIITHGFRKGGIFPFDDTVIAPESFDPLALKRWKQFNENGTNELENQTSDIIQEEIPTTSNQTSETRKTAIIEDEIPSTSNNIPVTPSFNTSFEELLLKAVKSGQHTTNVRRKRVATGAEVITSEEVVNRVKEKEREKGAKPKKPKNTPKPKKMKKLMKKINTEPDETSESESFSIVSTDDEEGFEDVIQREIQEEAELEEFVRTVTDKKSGDWVLTKFATKKTIKHYVELIEDFSENGDPLVRFVRKSSSSDTSTVFHYPVKEDLGEIPEKDVISLLPQPTLGRRGELIFEITFSQYNIQ